MARPIGFFNRVCGKWRCGFIGALYAVFPLTAAAEDALIAVATNFAGTAHVLEEQFESESLHRISLVTGSSGKLYAQILNGAPFAAFLSADQLRPARLVQDGFAVAGTGFTYARGKLALWGAFDGPLGPKALQGDQVRHVAIANPDLAPYGFAALQAIERLGMEQALSDRLVIGQNAGQAFSMVASGNAQIGFVAVSNLLENGGAEDGNWWPVPQEFHSPIFQDAVLLTEDAPAAKAFLQFLQTDTARAIMDARGYLTMPE